MSRAMWASADPQSGLSSVPLGVIGPPPGSPADVSNVAGRDAAAGPLAPAVAPLALKLPMASSKADRPPTRIGLSPRASTVWIVTPARLAAPTVVS